MLRLSTFGTLGLTQDGRRSLPLSEKALIIICHMMIEGSCEVSRDALVRLLWGSTSPGALANFRKLVERVRKSVADGWPVPLRFSGETAYLDRSNVTADFEVFASGAASVERLGTISRLMQEEFLPGIEFGTNNAWVVRQRDRFAAILRQLLVEANALATTPAEMHVIKASAKLVLELSPRDLGIGKILLGAHGSGEHRSLSSDCARDVGQDLADIVQAGFPPNIARLVLLAPSQNNHQTSIAQALIEDITISLCALRTVAVVAPYTAARIRSHPDKLAQLEKHAISYVLDTSMSGDGIFVQMIFLPSDSLLWAQRFPLRPDALVSHRKDVAQMIVSTVSDHLRHSAEKLTDFRAAPDVYRSYLASAQHLNKYTLQDLRRARNGFRETLKLKPDFAPALAGISRTFSWEWVLTARGDHSLLVKASEFAQTAVRHEPASATAYRELGLSRLYGGDVDASLDAFDHAERLSPQLADAVCGYADALVHASRPADGLAKISRAISLNPIPPDDYFWIAAGASYFLGEYHQSIDFIERMKDPSSAQRLLAACYAMAGDQRKARLHRRKAVELNPHFDLEKWLAILPVKEKWQKELYREGLSKAGF